MISIGDYARYNDYEDKKEYLVVDCTSSEIAILVDFPYYPDRIRQLKIWQQLSRFDKLEMPK